MSTEIKTQTGHLVAVIDTTHRLGNPGEVYVGMDPEESGYFIPRADFLAAVAKECAVIVVDRAEWPEVTGDCVNGYKVRRLRVSGQAYRNGDDARENARNILALAEYLDAHPPVDEAQVEALTADICAIEANGQQFASTIARRLVEQGWSK